MIVKCSVCGNPADSEKGVGSYFCKVCGSTALWEAAVVFDAEVLGAECARCGNPISAGAGERYKCAVCGFVGTVPAKEEQSDEISKPRISSVKPQSDKPENEPAAFSEKKELKSDAAKKLDKSETQTDDAIRRANVNISTPETESVRANADLTEPKSETVKRQNNSAAKRRKNDNIVAFATDKGVSSACTSKTKNFADANFKNIFIVPAPLNARRSAEPDVSFLMKDKTGREVKFAAPLVNTSGKPGSEIAALDALPYYMRGGLSAQDAFLAFKKESGAALCGISIFPCRLEEDLIYADKMGCDFVEVSFAHILPPGTPPFDAAQSITKARGIINRRSLELYLIIKTGALTSADVVKALCLGADACSAGESASESEFIAELKEYCALCAHERIDRFNRNDLIFK